MFAVIQTGGKQYKVASNDTLKVEKLAGEPGDKVTLQVIAVGNDKQVAVGAAVSGATVTAEILSQDKADKVVIFKKKRRQNYRRTKGHRQPLTSLFISEIVDEKGNKVAADAAKKPQPKKVAEPAAKKPAAKQEAAKPAAKKAAAPKKEAAKPAAKKAESKSAEKPAAAKKPAAKKTESKKAE